MIAAGLELLNSAAGIWARAQLFDQAATARRPRGSHTGMRAIIEYYGPTLYRTRYAGGGGIVPLGSFKMLLDRIDERHLGLHIHTFFPLLPTRPPNSWAEVKYRDGTLFGRGP